MGRHAELQELRESLLSRCSVLIHGAAGIGKSALAATLVRNLLGDSEAESVYRVHCRNEGSVVDFWERLLPGHLSQNGTMDQVESLMSEWTRLNDRIVYLIMDDLDQASAEVILSVGTLINWIERSNESDRVKVLLTCQNTTREMVRAHIFKHVSPSTLGEMELHRLHAPVVEHLLLDLLSNAGFTCGYSLVKRATWLSSGHPGYCRTLVDALAHTEPRVASVTTRRFEVAVKRILHRGFGAQVRSRWEKLSPEAGALVLYCALHDGRVDLTSGSAGDAVKTLITRRKKARGWSFDIKAAAVEASESGSDPLVVSEAEGVALADDACRPYLRALSWTSLGITEGKKLHR
jgi:hypothetical protein